jgi:hypothetical protein
MMKRSEVQSFTETGIFTRVSYLKICVMAREYKHFLQEMSTRETLRMAGETGLASTIGMVGVNMTVPGRTARGME